MKIWAIALKDLRILIKDKQTIALVLILPIVLIVVLGLSFHSLFEKNQANIPPSNVVLIDNDNTEHSKYIKKLFEQKEIKELVELVSMNREEALEAMKAEDVTAIITIPKGFGECIDNYDPVSIKILKDEAWPVESSIVNSIIEKYTDLNSCVLIAGKAADKEFKEYNMDGRMILNDVSDLINRREENIIAIGGITASGKSMTSMQYFSAANLTMFIFFVGMVGSALLVEEREDNTLKRMLTTYASKTTIISGKILGIFILGLIDVAILIGFTKVVYKVDWGNSILGLIILSLAMSFAASGLAILIASMFRSAKVVDMVTPVVILVMGFIGGNLIPLQNASTFLRRVSYILINNWSLRGYMNLMINGGVKSILMPSLIITAMGGGLMGLGIKRLKI